jgi:hypothetical protein
VGQDLEPQSSGDIEGRPGQASDFDLVAASIRADASDTETFFRVLVVKMSDALGDRVTVKRSGGPFKRDRPVTGVDIDLTNADGGVVLSVRRDRGSVACSVGRKVRGIVLSTKQVPMAQWIEELVSALADEARRSEQTWTALHGLLS